MCVKEKSARRKRGYYGFEKMLRLCRSKNCFSRWMLIATFLVLAITSFLYTKCYNIRRDLQSRNIKSQNVYCKGILATDVITPLEDNQTFIIAAYYDNRENNISTIRIISIINFEKVKELYCWFCCTTGKGIVKSKATIDIHTDRFGFQYVTTDLLCQEPPRCQAEYVSVHTSLSESIKQRPQFKILNREPKAFSANFTVCISTMFKNYSNILQFIQTIEMYKLLGAQKVVIYKNSCSPQMEEIMEYYIKEGTVEVIPWLIERYLRPANAWHYSLDPKDIGYYGQLTTLNDCIYRNMYTSKFVLLNDLDEIILPYHHQNWDSMMNTLQQQNPHVGAFLIENHIFPQTIVTIGNFSDISAWKSVPGFNILQYVHREPASPNYFNARKMILNPRKVIQTSVHSILKAYAKSHMVPIDTAIVYHCRGRLQKNLTKASHIEDKNIWRFSKEMISHVNNVLLEMKLIKK
ncbi:glycosyltransferase family 92 protein F13G3.3-like isoform 1-T3 [Discoglossus pictus]